MTRPNPRIAGAAALVCLLSCALDPRSDYLVGRTCAADDACDAQQKCLPHAVLDDAFVDYRCRDEASFRGFGSQNEPPLAYCDDEALTCPGSTVCRGDRIRALDGGVRRRVCQPAETPFGPPP